MRSKKIRDPAHPTPAAGTLDVVTEAQRQEALLKTGALQSAIFNSANFSSIATDVNGVIQIFNVGAERMLGYAAADVMNKITPADISDPQEVIARAKALSVELGTPITPGFEALVFKASRGIEDIYELTYIRKDGSRFGAVVSVTALRDAQDAIIGYLLIGTDNTARPQIEEERQKPIDAQALVSSILRRVKPASGPLTSQIDRLPDPRPSAAAAWPEIAGIDSHDVRERLGDDFALFISMLKRLLDEFSGVAVSALADEPAALDLDAHRLHKLRGSAGMLGAKAIQQLAGEAEAACAAGDADRATRLAAQLATQLQRLRECATPALLAAQAQADAVTLPAGPALEPQDLADFLDLLRQQSLSAIHRFSSLSPQLRRLLSKDSYDLVRDHIENLQFSEAAKALEVGRGQTRARL